MCLHLYLLVQEEVQGYRLTWGRNAAYSPQILQPQVPAPLTSGGADRWMMERASPPGPLPTKALLLVWDSRLSPTPAPPNTTPGPRPERTSCLNRLSTPSWQPPNLAPSLFHTANSATGGLHLQLHWG